MRAFTYTNAKKNLKALINAVCQDSEPAIIVNNQSEQQVVLISLDDYQAMERDILPAKFSCKPSTSRKILKTGTKW